MPVCAWNVVMIFMKSVRDFINRHIAQIQILPFLTLAIISSREHAQIFAPADQIPRYHWAIMHQELTSSR